MDIEKSLANESSINNSTEKILTENPDLYKHWTSLIPVGHMGQPEDLMARTDTHPHQADGAHRNACRAGRKA